MKVQNRQIAQVQLTSSLANCAAKLSMSATENGVVTTTLPVGTTLDRYGIDTTYTYGHICSGEGRFLLRCFVFAVCEQGI
jgi:hypothetical protein